MLETVPSADWEDSLERWIDLSLDRLERAERRHWAPLCAEGLLRPAEWKSVTHLAEYVTPGDSHQLHHFVSTSP